MSKKKKKSQTKNTNAVSANKTEKLDVQTQTVNPVVPANAKYQFGTGTADASNKAQEAPAPPETASNDKPEASAGETTHKRVNLKQIFRAVVIIAACLAALILAFALFAYTTTENISSIEQHQEEADTAHEELAQVVAETHVHVWEKDTELIHHDAETHDVYHDPVYETVDVLHTVCNTCNEIIDGETAQHKQDTGHESYTVNVPIPTTQLVSAGYWETIVDVEAYDELVSNTETCTECGVTRVIEEDDEDEEE